MTPNQLRRFQNLKNISITYTIASGALSALGWFSVLTTGAGWPALVIFLSAFSLSICAIWLAKLALDVTKEKS